MNKEFDEAFVCETPAIDRRRNCLNCGNEFNQMIRGQTICGDCLDERKTKKYGLYLKSHCEAPDYEDEVEAESKKEAIKKFLEDPALKEWDEGMIREFVGQI